MVHREEKEKRQGENKGWRRFKKAWTEVFDNNRRRVAVIEFLLATTSQFAIKPTPCCYSSARHRPDTSSTARLKKRHLVLPRFFFPFFSPLPFLPSFFPQLRTKNPRSGSFLRGCWEIGIIRLDGRDFLSKTTVEIIVSVSQSTPSRRIILLGSFLFPSFDEVRFSIHYWIWTTRP